MTEPICPNPKCATYPMLYQRTEFDGGRITEIHTCSRCKRDYRIFATTLEMLPTESIEDNSEPDSWYEYIEYEAVTVPVDSISDTPAAPTLEITRVDDADLLAALRTPDGSEAGHETRSAAFMDKLFSDDNAHLDVGDIQF